jgi:predicted nucleic acid-binding protein
MSAAVVVDTSALVELLVGEDVPRTAVRAQVTGKRIAVPHAADLEIAAVLRGLVHGGKLDLGRAGQAVDLFARMRLRRHPHTVLLPRIWELRHNLWPYDAAYVALAEALRVPLLTMDAKISAAPGLRCLVTNLRD